MVVVGREGGGVLGGGRSFFFQAEDGIRDAQESRGLGDVYKRQTPNGQKLLETLSSSCQFTHIRRLRAVTKAFSMPLALVQIAC